MSFDEWKIYKIEDILIKIIDNRGKNPPFAETGYPYIDTTCIVGQNRFPDYSLVRKYISEETYKSWFRSGHPEKNDLLVATVGANIGKICLMDDAKACIAQNTIGLRINRKLADPTCIYYFLSSNEFQMYLKSLDIGSAQPSIKVPHLLNVPLRIPSLLTQRRIASILSALDDKIELNHQTNATLEAIAQAIFKEWFIDFNFPGATGEMKESELGMIPAGWRVGSVLEIADLLSGGTPSTRIAEYWEGEIPWVSAKDVSNSKQTFILDTERKISQLGIDNSSTKILPELTTIVTARGTVGNYSILARPMAMNQTNYGLKSKVDGTDYFTFYSLGNLVSQLQKAAYGTIFDTVTTRTFEQSRIIIPAKFLTQEFDRQIASTMKAILNNLEQSITLIQIRDRLLPKLMRGEIDV